MEFHQMSDFSIPKYSFENIVKITIFFRHNHADYAFQTHFTTMSLPTASAKEKENPRKGRKRKKKEQKDKIRKE